MGAETCVLSSLHCGLWWFRFFQDVSGIFHQTLQEFEGVSLWYVCEHFCVCACVCVRLCWGSWASCVRFSLAGGNSPAVSNELCSTYCFCFTREITLWSSSSPSPSSLRTQLVSALCAVWAPHQCISVSFSLLSRCPHWRLDVWSDSSQRIKPQ